MDQVNTRASWSFEREQCHHDAAGEDPGDDQQQPPRNLNGHQRAIQLK